MSDDKTTASNTFGSTTINISGNNHTNILSNISGSVNLDGGISVNFNSKEETSRIEKEEEVKEEEEGRFGLRVGPIEKVNELEVYPLQIKCPSDFKITGFLATFTTEISVNTNLSHLWSGLAVIGEKSIAHALNVNRGLVGTDNWQTVMYLNDHYQLYTSNIVNTKTNQYPCTLDIVDSNNKIITYHKNNTPNFIDESYNELELVLMNRLKSQSRSIPEQNKKKKLVVFK